MESNGQRGKIQVSPATATRLREGGKEGWLTAREDLVEAKGIGLIQTYWVEPIRSAHTAASVLTSTHQSFDDSVEDDEPRSRDDKKKVALTSLQESHADISV